MNEKGSGWSLTNKREREFQLFNPVLDNDVKGGDSSDDKEDIGTTKEFLDASMEDNLYEYVHSSDEYVNIATNSNLEHLEYDEDHIYSMLDVGSFSS